MGRVKNNAPSIAVNGIFSTKAKDISNLLIILQTRLIRKDMGFTRGSGRLQYATSISNQFYLLNL